MTLKVSGLTATKKSSLKIISTIVILYAVEGSKFVHPNSSAYGS